MSGSSSAHDLHCNNSNATVNADEGPLYKRTKKLVRMQKDLQLDVGRMKTMLEEFPLDGSSYGKDIERMLLKTPCLAASPVDGKNGLHIDSWHKMIMDEAKRYDEIRANAKKKYKRRKISHVHKKMPPDNDHLKLKGSEASTCSTNAVDIEEQSNDWPTDTSEKVSANDEICSIDPSAESSNGKRCSNSIVGSPGRSHDENTEQENKEDNGGSDLLDENCYPSEDDSSTTSLDSIEFDSFELDTDDVEHYRTVFRKNRLFMSTQGFKSNPSIGISCEHEAVVTTPEEVHSVEFEAKTYHRGAVYEYCYVQNEIRNVLVGIVGFDGKDSAMCVEIVPFKSTFLGVMYEEINDKSLLEFDISVDFPGYVQVMAKPSCYLALPLANFGSRFEDVQTLPKWVYEPQCDEDSWEAFAYYMIDGNNSNTIKRCGRRYSKRTIIECFAGAGGSHEAYKKAGFRPVQLVEKDDCAFEALCLNNEGDVDKIFHGCVYDAINEQVEQNPDVLHFSPPCCGFSQANRYGGKNDKSNSDLSLEFANWLQKKRPKLGCFENVMGMWRRKHVHYLVNVIAGVLKAGYQVRCRKVNTADYGDPQTRSRLFLLVSQNGLPLPKFPSKQYGKGLSPVVTVGHVLRTDGIGTNANLGASSEKVKRLDPSKPAPTIIAQGMQPLHPFEDRKLNAGDMLKLFSLSPESFILKGSDRKQRKQVGNMIPFKTMSAIASEMMEMLEFEYE